MNDVEANADPNDGDLCLAHVKQDGTDVGCKKEPSFGIIRALHWSPDGRQILGTGIKLPAGQAIFGIVRWTVKKDKPAFSPDIADWNTGKFVTDIETPGKGVLDAAISPERRAARAGDQPGLVVLQAGVRGEGRLPDDERQSHDHAGLQGHVAR